METFLFDAYRLSRLRQNLRRWYARHARELPWRNSSNPYTIWISEIMLQQTTVVAVVPYFDKFLKRFPTVKHLATATEENVLSHWEGLGYYSRARNIHKTAKLLVEEFDGQFPSDVESLLLLPGIGRYTAGAIASFAFDLPAPIVEANTLRLYCRLMGYTGVPQSTAGQKLLWAFADQLITRHQPGLFNQALMELGSLVCTPKEPACIDCPLKNCCVAFEEGTTQIIPTPKPRPQMTNIVEATIAIKRKGKYLLRRCQPGERWQGLWDFQRFPLPEKYLKQKNVDTPLLHQKLEQNILEQSGFEVKLNQLESEFQHTVTRYRIRLLCYSATLLKGKSKPNQDQQWVSLKEIETIPLSVTGRKFARKLMVITS